MDEHIVKHLNYSARPGADGNVELVVEIEGHREVQTTSEAVFELHPAEAEALWGELGRVLGKWPS